MAAGYNTDPGVNVLGRINAQGAIVMRVPLADLGLSAGTPYYSATGRLLVPNNTPINSIHDLAGKTIATTRGSIYSTWTKNCFKNSTLLEVDGTAAAPSR